MPGGPVTPKEKVPSLPDETGELFTPGKVPEFLARARLDQVSSSSARRSTPWPAAG
jgi:hypothetical protein